MSPRLCLMLFVALGLCLNVSFVTAQTPRPATRPANGRPATTTPPAKQPAENAAAKPKAGPQLPGQPKAALQVKPVSDEVWKLLLQWEAKTQGIKSLSCEVKRLEFDTIFATETRSQGKVQFEQPDHGRLDFGPANAAWLAKPGRVTKENKPYKIVAGEATTWICTGQNVYAMHLNDKTYDLIDIPPALQGQNITRSPLPFIFGMKANDAVQRYAIKLGPFHNPDGSRKDAQGNPMPAKIHVIANPFDPNVAKEYVQAEFLLDPESYLPLHLRMLDPSFNKETVYSFDHSTMKQNEGFGFLKANPFKQPNVTGWQLMHHLKDEPVAPAGSPKGPLKQAERPTQRPAQR